MNAKQTAPLIPALATAAIAAPPLIAGVAIGLALLWLFSDKEETPQTSEDKKQMLELPPPPIDVPFVEISAEENPPREVETGAPDAPVFTQSNPRIAREHLAEALEYGARMFTKKEAVTALQELGFRKTAAYKALSPKSKFGSLLEFTPDGLVEWKG